MITQRLTWGIAGLVVMGLLCTGISWGSQCPTNVYPAPGYAMPAPYYGPANYMDFQWPDWHLTVDVNLRAWYFLNIDGDLSVSNPSWPDRTYDFGNDGMNLDDSGAKVQGKVSFQAYGADGPRLRLSYMRVDLDGKNNKNQMSNWQLPDPGHPGIALPPQSLAISSDFNLDIYEITFEFATYETASGLLTFRPLVELKPMQVKATVDEDELDLFGHFYTYHRSVDQWTAFPLLGTTVNYALFEGVSLKGEVKGMYYFGSGHIFDIEAGFGFLPWTWLELEGGYRILTMQWKDIGDLDLHTTMHGPYIGATLRF